MIIIRKQGNVVGWDVRPIPGRQTSTVQHRREDSRSSSSSSSRPHSLLQSQTQAPAHPRPYPHPPPSPGGHDDHHHHHPDHPERHQEASKQQPAQQPPSPTFVSPSSSTHTRDVSPCTSRTSWDRTQGEGRRCTRAPSTASPPWSTRFRRHQGHPRRSRSSSWRVHDDEKKT